MENKKFISSHKLDFLVADYKVAFETPYKWFTFKVGTCHGLFCVTKNSYEILAILNEELNNGHFDDVLEWFENSCKRDGYSLVFLETWNYQLRQHLINKRGFEVLKEEDVIKRFN